MISDPASPLAEHAFPYTRECVYLNTAATGLAWPGASAAAGRFYGGPLARGFDGHEAWQALAQDVSSRLVTLLGWHDAQIDFFSGTTHALNLVAQGMAWRAGDEVVMAADEHPSVMEPWSRVPGCAPRVSLVDVPHEGDRQARLLEAITSDTRVLVVSHVNSHTGTRLDLQALGAQCRTQGALLVVDGIQAIGAIAVNAAGVDVYCAATFKWLLSGFGLSFMATSAAARAQLSPAFRGYRNPYPSASLQYAHVNYPALYVLQDSLARFEEYGPQMYERVESIAARLKEAMRDLGLCVVTPFDRGSSAGIVSVRMADAAEAGAMVRELSLRRISVATRGDMVRASPHFYNREPDADALAAAWREIVRMKSRYL